jgi:hypothetical protein
MNDPKMMELKKIRDFHNFITNNEGSKILNEFEHSLHYKNCFFNVSHPVFDNIKNMFVDHTVTLAQNETIYRARIVEDDELEEICKEKYFEENFYGFNKKDSFAPPIKYVSAGRVNPSGIPCLYAAKEEKTAIAEVRPFMGKNISVAKIQLLHSLKIFDLFIDLNLSETEIIKQQYSDLWLDIALLFSIPCERNSEKEYLLTQCISEYVKLSGFDGIQYSSSLHEGGKNIALFNCKNEKNGGKYDICEPISSHICTIKRIEHCYEFFN